MNNIDLSKLDKDQIEEYLTNLYTELDAYRDEAEKIEGQISKLTQNIQSDSSYTKRDEITQKVADQLFVYKNQYCAFCKQAEEIEAAIDQAENSNKYAKDYNYDKNKVSIDIKKCLKEVYKKAKKESRRTIFKRRASKFANKVLKFKGAKKITIPKKTKTSSIDNMDLEQLGQNIDDFFMAIHNGGRMPLKQYDLAKKYIETEYLKFSELLANRKKQEKENMTEKEKFQKEQGELQEKINLYKDYIDFEKTNADYLVAQVGNITHEIPFSNKDKAFEILQEYIDAYEAGKLAGMEQEEDLELDEELDNDNLKQEQNSPRIDPAALPDPSTSIDEEVDIETMPKKESEILKEKWQEDRQAAKELYDELYSKLDDVKARKQEIYDLEKQERQELADLYGVNPTAIENQRTEENAKKLEELDAEENRILENIHSELGHLNEMNRQDAIEFRKAYDAKVKEENFDPVKAKLNEMDDLYWDYKRGKKGAHFTDEARAEVLADLERERAEFVAQNNIPNWIKKGQALISPEKYAEWEKCVAIRAKDLYHGEDLDDALEIMQALENGASIEEATQIFAKQDHSGSAAAIVRSILHDFSSKGPEFYEATTYEKMFPDMYQESEAKEPEETVQPIEPTPALTSEQIEANKQKAENNPFTIIDRLSSMEEIVSYIKEQNLTEEEMDRLNETKEQYKRDYPGLSEMFCYKRALMGIENDRKNNINQNQTKSNTR